MSDTTTPQTDGADLALCDVVFRGGVTSGVVYPGFVKTLAEKYRFKRIGGASAGAIAAGLTAAAEYGRRKGKNTEAFKELGSLADQVSGGEDSVTSFKKLFRPSREVASLGILVQAILVFMGWRRSAKLASVAIFVYVISCMLYFVPSFLAWLLVGGAFVFGFWAWRQVEALKKQGFGLCTGVRRFSRSPSAPTMEDLRKEGALADWLHAEIQRLAGRKVASVKREVVPGAETPEQDIPESERPLTMSDLWGSEDEDKAREIDLVLTTTNLTQQLPHEFPFLEKTWNRLFFRPDTLEKVLPADVVAWMVRKARQSKPSWPTPEEGYFWLPKPGDLPVVFGVRLSLSFPGLISAVPLYAHDHGVDARALRPLGAEDIVSRARETAAPINHQSERQGFTPKRCWFSDGGITSNFPISVFDAPVPNYPTFCITLRSATPAEIELVTKARAEASASPLSAPSADFVWLARDNRTGMAPRFLSQDETLLGFVSAILDTARNARENELMLMPGQRDRIVHVLTTEKEGGLNLDMPPSVIRELSERGERAARLLLDRFSPGSADGGAATQLGWANHRWIRFRTTMAALERYLARLSEGDIGCAQQPQKARISTMLSAPPSYRWLNDKQRDQAKAAYRGVLLLARIFRRRAARLNNGVGLVFDTATDRDGAPRPPSALGLRPMSLDPRDRGGHR
ncbi:MAG: patatin-like phospholipase family protein [Roseococcus sp.]